MPYSLDVFDSAQPLDTDEGLVLGGEVRAIKGRAFGAKSVITGNITVDKDSNGLTYKHTEATARNVSLPSAAIASPTFREGGSFKILNLAGAGTISIIKNGTFTLERVGAGAVTSITLAAGGWAECIYVDTDHWAVIGSGLS